MQCMRLDIGSSFVFEITFKAFYTLVDILIRLQYMRYWIKLCILDIEIEAGELVSVSDLNPQSHSNPPSSQYATLLMQNQ